MASAALLVGCTSGGDGGSGSTGSGSGEPMQAGIIGDQSDAGSPADGGTLSFAGYALPSSLDPVKTQPAGSTGGTEMVSVYDLLMRYDAESGEFVPQLAETLTESDDHLSWTLKLPDGVTFSDGTPFDAQAVVDSTNRYNELHGANSEQFVAGVKSVVAEDPTTVLYNLNQPWHEFPALLTFGHGMIVAPAAYADPENFQPIGAGPFTVASFTPGSKLVMKPRADYWDGPPHLDELNFVTVQGEQAKIDALNSGDIQMAFMLQEDKIDDATEQFPGFYEPVSMGDVGAINNREGHPGAIPEVRHAMQLAIDPDVINQRAKNDKGMPGSELFQKWSKWHSDDVSEVTPDLERARRLLNKAKAEGYDGHLTYVGLQSQTSQDIAVAVQAMLQQVGFTVDVEYAATSTDVVQRLYVDHDFDLTHTSNSISDAVPFMRLSASMRSDSSNNMIGYSNPKMDALLEKTQQSTSDDEKRAGLAQIANLINEDAPVLIWGAGANFVPWTQNVHGAVPSTDGIMLLGDVWLS
ncbi:ABC transporter substrate-binding protein [Tomitella cavernea]|uniref:ABC transporter substrate-binding protein n=1 Tax=Tomitella cavernea TaxID=1387982 RepID=UPI0031EDBD5C